MIFGQEEKERVEHSIGFTGIFWTVTKKVACSLPSMVPYLFYINSLYHLSLFRPWETSNQQQDLKADLPTSER